MNEELFERARRYIPGGVNSPVRAFGYVGGTPIFIARAEGAYVHGEDGRRYVDYVGSWGPMILGHAHPKVVSSVQAAAARGLSFGAPTVLETELAAKICELMPAIERVRLVSSGTEATMSAIRLARACTGRDAILKFEGCYHGHSDSLLVKAGSGALTVGVPSSPGVPPDFAAHTLTASFNDLDDVRAVFARAGERIACVIVEPVAGNMNCIPPAPDFLEGLRELCTRFGALLVFDEVMTGFRVALGGAQARFGVTPDLTTLGKIVGGGAPVGAFGGRRELMERIAPMGPVYQAGTLSGCPLATAAGLTTLGELTHGLYTALEEKTRRLTQGLREAARTAGIPLSTNAVGSMFGLFFTAQDPVRRFDQVMACDAARFRRFFHAMLAQGVYFAPSPYEAGFVSAAHGDAEIDATIAAARVAFAQC